MPLHMIKLCVGVSEVDELREWQDRRLANGGDVYHVTRMFPRRGDELLAGGSLYWVIKSLIQVRQRIVDLVPVTDEEGVSRCKIVFDPQLHLTRPQPRRPFQGWRYLPEEDVPEDLPSGGEMENLDPRMRAELAELGLL